MLEGIKIKINEEEFLVKKSYRALMLFEEKTGRGVDEIKETVNDLMLLFWCILSANNRETFKYTFDEFIDVIDNNPESVTVFSNFLVKEGEKSPQSTGKKKVKPQ